MSAADQVVGRSLEAVSTSAQASRGTAWEEEGVSSPPPAGSVHRWGHLRHRTQTSGTNHSFPKRKFCPLQPCVPDAPSVLTPSLLSY